MSQRVSKSRNVCPHCGQFARVRYSEQITPLYREGVVECQNAECGWRGSFSMEFTATLTPSQQPAPGIKLPLKASVRRALLAQLNCAAS
ncbi:ogr/Delta-like zinc finger family protein [Halomonas cupida]|uniref:ogr/Delta-like zinc finger family protein n=1 Tax=Halomonas cupida TaxID=44933 RepID=UPI0039B6E7BB